MAAGTWGKAAEAASMGNGGYARTSAPWPCEQRTSGGVRSDSEHHSRKASSHCMQAGQQQRRVAAEEREGPTSPVALLALRTRLRGSKQVDATEKQGGLGLGEV